MSKKIKIAKRHTDIATPRFPTVMKEVNKQTPRGAAIAGSAYLDLLLRGALEKMMRDDDKAVQATLFENRGGLQDFSTRIHLCYALKVYEWTPYQDLLLIREVRNAFAHAAEGLDFDRPDVASLCDKLWFPSNVEYYNETKLTDHRSKFVRGIELMAHGLIQFIVVNSRRAAGLSDYFDPPILQMGPKKPPETASQSKSLERPSRGPEKNQKNDQ
jgi:DNA-binding MltR family transcriptional regulator